MRSSRSRLYPGARRYRPRFRAALVGALIALPVVAPAIGSAQEAPTTDVEAPRLVGELERFPNNLQQLLEEDAPIDHKQTTGNAFLGGAPVIDPVARRMFQFYIVPSGGVKMLVRDLDTLAKVDVRKISEISNLFLVIPAERRGVPAEVDSAGKRLFVWVDSWRNQGRRGVLVIDWSAPAQGEWYRFTEMLPQDGGVSVEGVRAVPPFFGMTYIPSERKLYARFEAIEVAATWSAKTDLMQIDVGAADRLTVAHNWTRWVRSCRNGDGGSGRQNSRWYPVAWRADNRTIYIPCNGSGSASVVAIPVSDAGLPLNERVSVGSGFAYQWVVDPIGQRLHGQVFSTLGPAVLTFDFVREAFVGLTAVGEENTSFGIPLGIDESAGRVYALGQDPRYGLSLIDGRLTPVPPGARFPQYPGYETVTSLSFMPIFFVPPTASHPARRVFVPDKNTMVGDDEPNAGGKFLILEDDPPLPEPAHEDPDRLTHDMPEKEGVTTQADFTGAASGYGTRLLAPGGIRGVPPALPFVSNAPETWPLKSQCFTADRELVLGRVDQSTLATYGRNAAAIAAQTDTTTKSDMNTPSRCDEGSVTDPVRSVPNGGTVLDNLYASIDEQLGQPWPFRRTECPLPTADGDTLYADSASADVPTLPGFSSAVNCFPNEAKVTASGLAETIGAGGQLSVASSGITTQVIRDPKRGVVSRAIAFARGIDLGGVVKIDGVYAFAESWATGRPKGSNKVGAGTRYVRTVMGFTSPGFSCGHENEEPCGDAQELASAVNRAFSGNLSMNFPPLENGGDGGPKLADGTDKGYQAAVQRDNIDALNSQFSNGDPFRELPAMEIVRFNDGQGWGKQRQIFQFAGLLVNSQYSIRPLSDGSFGGDTSTSGGETFTNTDGSSDGTTPQTEVLGGTEQVSGAGNAGGSVAAVPASPGISQSTPSLIPRIASQLTRGLTLLFTNPKTAGLVAGVILLLLLPFALAQRRYLLMEAMDLDEGTAA